MKRSLIKFAIAYAEKNVGNHPNTCFSNQLLHYSFIIRNNQIISIGKNTGQYYDLPKYYGYPSYSKVHAELDAYKKLNNRKVTDFDVLNIRITKEKVLKMSAPCNSCKNYLSKHGCKKIYFTTDSGEIDFVECN